MIPQHFEAHSVVTGRTYTHMGSLDLLILCLPWLLSLQLQPTPAPQQTPTLGLCMQSPPRTYLPLSLHSFLHLAPPAFIQECPSCTHSSLPPYRTLHSQVSFIHSSFLQKTLVIHLYFLLPMCLYSLIHLHWILQCPFCIDFLQPR